MTKDEVLVAHVTEVLASSIDCALDKTTLNRLASISAYHFVRAVELRTDMRLTGAIGGEGAVVFSLRQV